MGSMTLQVDVSANETYRELMAIVQKLDERVSLHAQMGLSVKEEVRDYLRELSLTRHDTANRLGGKPTGFLGEAAQAVEDASVTADGTGAEFAINHPGIGRAFEDVIITPRQAESLALPIAGIVYGIRPAAIWDAWGLFIAKGMIMMKNGADADPIALYKLVRSVHQKQDRTLLPSDLALEMAAEAGANLWIEQEALKVS